MKNLTKKKPFIIAEIGANHNGNLLIAKQMINKAKLAGCDAVKFQSWDDKLFTEKFYKKNPKIKKEINDYQLKFKHLKILRDHAKKKKILFGTTVFDTASLKNAIKVNCDYIKIASMDIDNSFLLQKVSKIKKLLIVSTGTANENEIIQAAKIFKKAKKKNVVFLHCISLYPPKNLKILNLKNIKLIRDITGYDAGYSDHSTLKDIPLIATSLGAVVIEKHFTLDKKMEGWDHAISADFKEMSDLVKSTKNIIKIVGNYQRKISKKEIQMSRLMRRGIYTSTKIKKNERFNTNNIILQRPTTTLSAKYYDKILRKKSLKNLNSNKKLNFRDINF